MKKTAFWGTFLAVPVLLITAALAGNNSGGNTASIGEYKLLSPITHGDLTIFPAITANAHDTSGFLTLDEGIRSGEVVVSEVGSIHGMIRRRRPLPQDSTRAEVNRLVLVNNSKRPLILLAGEVVTGGKQDRVVGKDRIVPAESDPVDLSVFCVEPGRWVGTSAKFDTHASVMAQPSVRKKAMVDADQQKVWNEVGAARTRMAETLSVESAPAAVELNGTTSYAKAIENSAVKRQMESITAPMQKSYESVIKQLRNQNAVGVVVAVKGRIVWADIFASNALLDKYWPKLLQSYAAESLTASGSTGEITVKDAQRFLDDWQARHETVDSEPGLYRQRELVGDRFRAFELTSLLARANFDVHVSKMAE